MLWTISGAGRLGRSATVAVVGTGGIPRGMSQTAPLKVGVLHPTSGYLAQIGQACRRGADVANDVFADVKLPVKLDIVPSSSTRNAE